jgi:hypothetical protein
LTPWWLWLALVGGLIVLLLLDVFVFHRRPDEIGVRQAVGWSVAWLALGLAFAFVVWAVDGATPAREYLAGYLIERTLSLDNLFVLAVILGYFAVPNAYRHRALLWGSSVRLSSALFSSPSAASRSTGFAGCPTSSAPSWSRPASALPDARSRSSPRRTASSRSCAVSCR